MRRFLPSKGHLNVQSNLNSLANAAGPLVSVLGDIKGSHFTLSIVSNWYANEPVDSAKCKS